LKIELEKKEQQEIANKKEKDERRELSRIRESLPV
jgi:hypothetical protein